MHAHYSASTAIMPGEPILEKGEPHSHAGTSSRERGGWERAATARVGVRIVIFNISETA